MDYVCVCVCVCVRACVRARARACSSPSNAQPLTRINPLDLNYAPPPFSSISRDSRLNIERFEIRASDCYIKGL